MNGSIGGWLALSICLSRNQLADVVGIFAQPPLWSCSFADVDALVAEPPFVDSGEVEVDVIGHFARPPVNPISRHETVDHMSLIKKEPEHIHHSATFRKLQATVNLLSVVATEHLTVMLWQLRTLLRSSHRVINLLTPSG